MTYKKKPFPLNSIFYSTLFIFFDLYTFYVYDCGKATDNGTLLLFVIIMTTLAVALSVCAIIEIIKHFIILGYMRDDKYIICTNFKSGIEEVHSMDADGDPDTSAYSVTFAEIIDGRGEVRKLKSERYSINHNPFEDGRTEIKVFIDIDKPHSPYYMYPYSDKEK